MRQKKEKGEEEEKKEIKERLWQMLQKKENDKMENENSPGKRRVRDIKGKNIPLCQYSLFLIQKYPSSTQESCCCAGRHVQSFTLDLKILIGSS